MAAVCHVTIMMRRHGNSQGKRSKIMVALKKLTLGVLLEYFKLTTERVIYIYIYIEREREIAAIVLESNCLFI